MPLIESGSDEAREKNIAELIKSGKNPKQAEAIAYDIQRKHNNMMAARIARGNAAYGSAGKEE